MNRITVSIDRPRTVAINGGQYEIQKSDCEVCAIGRAMLRGMIALDIRNPDAVLAFLQKTASDIDSILGAGSMAQIADGNPVQLKTVLEVTNALVAVCAEKYRQYIAREYTL